MTRYCAMSFSTGAAIVPDVSVNVKGADEAAPPALHVPVFVPFVQPAAFVTVITRVYVPAAVMLVSGHVGCTPVGTVGNVHAIGAPPLMVSVAASTAPAAYGDDVIEVTACAYVAVASKRQNTEPRRLSLNMV